VSSSIRFKNVSVVAPSGRHLLKDVSLEIAPGETVALIGRSGAGKTTLLRLVNGLVAATSGRIEIDDRATEDLVMLRRRVGYVVQNIGLFPHRTVFENVATVPRLLRWDDGRIENAVHAALDRVQLPPAEFGLRFPRTLSGGEQQRVGIARATVFDPDILLCDEPFGALDPIVRRDQQDLLVSSSREKRPTMLFVTHDLSEAFYVSNRIVLVDGGRIVADSPAFRFREIDHPLVKAFVDAAGIQEHSS